MPTMPPRPCFHWLLVCMLALCVYVGTALAGGKVAINVAPADLPGVEVEVTSAFEGIPLHGFTPLHIHVKNSSGRERTCRVETLLRSLSYRSGSLRGTLHVEVACPPGSEVQREILVPVPPTLLDSHSRSGRFQVSLSGSGQEASGQYYHSSQATPQWPAIAIGKKLANRNLEELKKVAEKRNALAKDFGLAVDSGKLSEDWRALGGIDVLLLMSAEWLGLSVRQRAAVRDWVHMGGTLDLHVAPGGGTLDEFGFAIEEGSKGGNFREIGLGRVRLFALQGEILDPAAVCQTVTKTAVRNRGKELSRDFKSSWQLSNELPLRTFYSPGWVCLLILFGILMGPVNLFFLAGKQRRHRLFVTTPLIALLSSVLLGVFILVVDGTGGSGHRFTVLELQPGKGGRKVYVNEQSLVSTGLLTRSSFFERHPTLHFPVALSESRWARITGRNGDSGSLDVSEKGEFRGDWLRSRSRHGFVSQTVVPSRARFELAGTEAAPALVSGLGFSTGKVFYLAPDGAVWGSAAETTATGERVALQRSNRAELKAWRKQVTERASSGLQRDLRELTFRPGYFYAAAGETGLEPSFVDSIRWEKSSAFLFGPVLAGGEEADSKDEGQEG